MIGIVEFGCGGLSGIFLIGFGFHQKGGKFFVPVLRVYWRLLFYERGNKVDREINVLAILFDERNDFLKVLLGKFFLDEWRISLDFLVMHMYVVFQYCDMVFIGNPINIHKMSYTLFISINHSLVNLLNLPEIIP